MTVFNLMGLLYFLLTCLVTIPLCVLFARCARNKWAMILMGFVLFAIGFSIYFRTYNITI